MKLAEIFERLVHQKYGRTGSSLLTWGLMLLFGASVYAPGSSGDRAVGVKLFFFLGGAGVIVGGFIIFDALRKRD